MNIISFISLFSRTDIYCVLISLSTTRAFYRLYLHLNQTQAVEDQKSHRKLFLMKCDAVYWESEPITSLLSNQLHVEKHVEGRKSSLSEMLLLQ